MTRETYSIEVTDTFGGEANYSWVRRYTVQARSMRGAITALARQHGAGWRLDYDTGEMARYNMRGACVCAFVELKGGMNMETVQLQIFSFSELSDEAKETAREWYRRDLDFPWSEDYRASITAFCDHFGVTLLDWSIGPWSPIEYKTDAENHHFRGVKLRSINRDHMPTGFCGDCDLWMTFHDRFKTTGNALAAFDDALYAGFKAWRSDWEFQYSDEAVDENIACNDYLFREDGTFWR